MKNPLLFVLLFLTLSFFGCGVTDSDTTITDDMGNDNVMNGNGQYDGVWRLISEEEHGYNDFKFNEVPEMNFFDIDSGSEEHSDTSFLLLLKKNSINLYMYDPEINTDTFLIEYLTLELLDEFDPDGFEESDIESLRSSLKSRFMVDSVSEISDFTIESIDNITASNDTLTITFGFHVAANFTVIKNDEIITGIYESEMAGNYMFVKYSGTLPPDSWPEDYVEEYNDEEVD